MGISIKRGEAEKLHLNWHDKIKSYSLTPEVLNRLGLLPAFLKGYKTIAEIACQEINQWSEKGTIKDPRLIIELSGRAAIYNLEKRLPQQQVKRTLKKVIQSCSCLWEEILLENGESYKILLPVDEFDLQEFQLFKYIASSNSEDKGLYPLGEICYGILDFSEFLFQIELVIAKILCRLKWPDQPLSKFPYLVDRMFIRLDHNIQKMSIQGTPVPGARKYKNFSDPSCGDIFAISFHRGICKSSLSIRNLDITDRLLLFLEAYKKITDLAQMEIRKLEGDLNAWSTKISKISGEIAVYDLEHRIRRESIGKALQYLFACCPDFWKDLLPEKKGSRTLPLNALDLQEFQIFYETDSRTDIYISNGYSEKGYRIFSFSEFLTQAELVLSKILCRITHPELSVKEYLNQVDEMFRALDARIERKAKMAMSHLTTGEDRREIIRNQIPLYLYDFSNSDSAVHLRQKIYYLKCQRENHDVVPAIFKTKDRWGREIDIVVHYCRTCNMIFLGQPTLDLYEKKCYCSHPV